MTRLPRPQAGQSIASRKSRMAPGGRMWSESPIRDVVHQVVMQAVEVGPLPPGWCWALDDESGDLVESAGGSPIALFPGSQTLGYRAAAIAPGSLYSVAFPTVVVASTFCRGQAVFNPSTLQPNAEGKIGLDFWVGNLSTLTATAATKTYNRRTVMLTSIYTVGADSTSKNLYMNVVFISGVANLAFINFDGARIGPLIPVSGLPDPLHVQWYITEATSHHEIYLNGGLAVDVTYSPGRGTTTNWSLSIESFSDTAGGIIGAPLYYDSVCVIGDRSKP